MTKTLIKKQLMEVFAWLYQDRKTGKNRDKKGIVIYALLYLFVFGALTVVFYQISKLLCKPLAQAGFDWLYMALMGIVSVTLGVFGSVFNTFSTLYQAKDNDLLFAMPITERSVLTARLSGVYAMGLMYELFAMIPAVIVYFSVAKMHLPGILFCLLIPFVLSFFVLTLSCILGWVVAVINSRLKNQKILTVIISLGFIGAYYYLCGSAGNLLQTILVNPQNIAGKIKGVLYPLYHMGLAAQGNALSMLIFTAIIAVLFAVVYLILHRSFFKLATENKGTAKVQYVEKQARAASAGNALLRKEFCRFLQSPNYMLNCGLGIVFMLIAAVALLIKQDVVKNMILKAAGYEDLFALVAVAAICMMTTMNDMAAPSISLEGKNLWLVQALPVSGWQVLKAKMGLQLILTSIPAALLTLCVEWVLEPELLFAVLIPATVLLFVVMMAAFGLLCNLKAPNLTWTSEIVPLKQSVSVILALFAGWVAVVAFAGVYYLLRAHVTPAVFLICLDVVLLVVDAALVSWMKGKGSRVFERLGN